MKRFVLLAVVALLALAAFAPAASAQQPTTPNTTITFLNPPAGGTLVLGVGESYTFQVRVTSDVPFNSARAFADQYYPGRGVFYSGTNGEGRGTEAILSLTITGKSPSLGAPNVVDGVLPVGVAVAVRYQGGVVVGQIFNLNVVVQ